MTVVMGLNGSSRVGHDAGVALVIVSPGAVDRLRGVVHADGTSRPQVVAEPGSYRDLLHEVGAAAAPRP